MIKIKGSSGIKIVKGNKIRENNPDTIPTVMINTKESIRNNKKNRILNGMLKIYNPTENSFINSTIPSTNKITENISILLSLLFHVISRNEMKRNLCFH
jgi:hypothetical protein